MCRLRVGSDKILMSTVACMAKKVSVQDGVVIADEAESY
jgi:hypothetical protein